MRSIAVRYTLLRLLVFFGCLLAAWFAGLRDDKVLLLLVAAFASMVISFVLLRGMRDDMTRRIIERSEQRQARKAGAAEGSTRRGGKRSMADDLDAEEDAELDEGGA